VRRRNEEDELKEETEKMRKREEYKVKEET
jgi:hypothetical protein